MIHFVIARLLYPGAVTAVVFLFIWWLIRRDAPLWVFLTTVMIVPVALMRSFAGLRIQGVHGLMHCSIIYRIFESGLPPENPLMALEPLRYAYFEHFLIAQLMKIIPLAPSLWFTIIDILGLLILACLIDRVACFISRDKSFRFFSILLAILGTSPLTWGPLKLAFVRLGLDPEGRLSPMGKFLTAQNNQVGLVASGLVLLGLAHVFGGTGRPVRGYVMVFVGMVAAGFLYPFSWLACGAMAGAIAVAFILRFPADGARRRGMIVLVLLAISVALVLPYVRSLTAGKVGKSEISLVYTYALVVRAIYNLAFAAALPAVVYLATRKLYLQGVREHRNMYVLLAIWSAVGALVFLLVAAPLGTQYKFLSTGFLGLGILLGSGLSILYHNPRLRVWAFALPAPMIFSLVLQLSDQIGDYPLADRLVERGVELRHADPELDALDQWIQRQTPRNSVLMDDTLIDTITTRRTMYLGYLNEQKFYGDVPAYRDQDGWSMPAWLFLLEVTGVHPDEQKKREDLVKNVFLAPRGPVDVDGLAHAARSLGSRPLYIIARDPNTADRLRGLPHLTEVFTNPAGTVFHVLRDA